MWRGRMICECSASSLRMRALTSSGLWAKRMMRQSGAAARSFFMRNRIAYGAIALSNYRESDPFYRFWYDESNLRVPPDAESSEALVSQNNIQLGELFHS